MIKFVFFRVKTATLMGCRLHYGAGLAARRCAGLAPRLKNILDTRLSHTTMPKNNSYPM